MERMAKTKSYMYFVRKSIRMEPIILQWLENTRFRVRESTYVKYRNLVQGHILPELGEVRANRLTTERVEQFVRQQLVSGKLDGQGGLAEKTVRDMLTVLKEICRYAAQCDIEIPCHFEVIRIRKNDSETRVLNRLEQMKLEQFLTSDDSLSKTGILLSLYMGLRIGEVCALKRQHILYDEEKQLFRQGHSDSEVPSSEIVCDKKCAGRGLSSDRKPGFFYRTQNHGKYF